MRFILKSEMSTRVPYLVRWNHYFVIAKSSKNCYLADGAAASYRYKEELEKLLNEKLTVIKYRQQAAEDHCGTSAILLSLEFAKRMDDAIIDGEISIGALALKKEIEEKLHPE